jgi:hypothetical protein
MKFFNDWGDRIAGGDILTDTIWHPYHTWHAEVAKKFGVTSDEQGKQKWGEWYGGKQYHQEPLYPLIIGVAKMIAGDGLLLIYIIQMLFGIFSIWMMMWLGRHYFGAMAAILGGLLFTFYSPNLLFDTTLLRTSFNTSLLIGFLFVAEKLMLGKSRSWIMGILGGLGYVLMTTSMLLWIPLLARWYFVRREDLKKIWQVALGFSLVLSFLVFRNSVTGSPLFSTSSVGPVTYVLSNFPKYKPELGFAYFLQAGQILEEHHGKMIPSALFTISMHSSIWGWIELQFEKLGAVFHWYEIPNNINTYLATIVSATLKVAFIPYSFIAALGLLGLFLNLKNKKTLNLHMAILSQIAIMVVFYVLCRFRVPLVAMLAIFGGGALQQILISKKISHSILLTAAFFGLWLTVLRPWPKIPVTFEKGDLAMYFQTYYLPKLDSLSVHGDLVHSAEIFEEFIGTMPESIRQPGSSSLYSDKEKELISYYGALYFDLGNLYKDIGQAAKAEECFMKSEKYKQSSQ